MPKSDQCQVRIVNVDRVEQARLDAIEERKLWQLSSIFKALGDPTRLKIVMALMGDEMCVCDLAAYLGVSESAVSHQLKRLRDMSLVQNRRAGQILYYTLDDEHVRELISVGLTHVME